MRWPTREYRIEHEVPLPRSKVWELLANTDHLNRLIGLFPIDSGAPRFDASLFHRDIEARVGGLIGLRWREFPFEWTKNRYYAVEREYLGGPLKHFYGGVKLEDSETVLPDGNRATIVKLFADFTPASMLGSVSIPLVGKRSMKKTLTYCADYLNMVHEGREKELPQPSSFGKANLQALEQKMSVLAEFRFHSEIIKRFKYFIVRAGDEEVANMRPYEWAERWGYDQKEALRLFLYATKEGLLNLSWELMCPNCRVSKVQTAALSALKPEFHCDLCGIEYEANFDRYVELRFSVAPAIRKASRRIFCIGGPFISPHVHTQLRIKQGETIKVQLPSYPEEYRLRVLGSNDILLLKPDSFSRYHAVFSKEGWQTNQLTAEVDEGSIKIENQSGGPVVVVLEQVEWDKYAVTAAEVTAMQEFRDLFSSEVLAPGQQIQVENVTLLFSDLRGSTALYEVVGDAHAYSNVRRHFDFLAEWVKAHSGAVVKTMGDAVMAVFYKPEDAVKAACDIYEKLREFNRQLPGTEPIAIKMGIHTGPAIAVNSNDRLDYFGRTVNLASRIQGTSNGDGFVLSQELFDQREVSAFLSERKVQTEWFEVMLKGIEGKARLVKISL